MSFGFVYILGNQSMPGLYKIGSTGNSPALRAQQLSQSTAAASPFTVICYGEFSHFKNVERDLHELFANQRHAGNREFFRGPLRDLVAALEHGFPGDRQSYCENEAMFWMAIEKSREGAK